MTQNNKNTGQRQWKRIARINFYFAMTIMYWASCPSSALGQTTYSDIWSDGSDIYGCGLTEDYYNSYNHTFAVATTIQSPNGRSSTTGAGYNTPYARADVSLGFDESDLGDYFLNSEHNYYCPIVSEYYFAGTTGAAAAASVYEVWYGFRYSVPNPYSGGTGCFYQKCEPSPCGGIEGQDWVPQGQSCPAGYKDTFRKFIICFHTEHVHLPTLRGCAT